MPVVESGFQYLAGPFPRPDAPLAPSSGVLAQRLLAKDVLARFQRRDACGSMNVVGGGNYHRIDLRRLRHLPPVGCRLGSVFPRPDAPRGRLGHRLQTQARRRAYWPRARPSCPRLPRLQSNRFSCPLQNGWYGPRWRPVPATVIRLYLGIAFSASYAGRPLPSGRKIPNPYFSSVGPTTCWKFRFHTIM